MSVEFPSLADVLTQHLHRSRRKGESVVQHFEAAWLEARTIRTVDQLDALPNDSVVWSEGEAWRKTGAWGKGQPWLITGLEPCEPAFQKRADQALTKYLALEKKLQVAKGRLCSAEAREARHAPCIQ